MRAQPFRSHGEWRKSVAIQPNQLPGVEILATQDSQTEQILTPDALEFVVDLERRFGPRRRELLAAREERQRRLDEGERPDFLAQTADIRDGN